MKSSNPPTYNIEKKYPPTVGYLIVPGLFSNKVRGQRSEEL